jgi:hypothetical protein
MKYPFSFVVQAQMKRCLVLLRSAVLAALLFASVKGNSADFSLNFTNTFSGTPPAGIPPLVTMLFQTVAPGTVDIVISNVGLTGTEFISEFDFNLNTNLNPNSLVFNNFGGSGDFTLPVITTGVNFQKADGDGYYDIKFLFDTIAGGRFGANDYVIYEITGIAGLTAADFAYLSAPGGGVGPFYAAAHIQSIGIGNSGWISPDEITPFTIPEPAAASMLVIAAALFLGRKFLFRGATR